MVLLVARIPFISTIWQFIFNSAYVFSLFLLYGLLFCISEHSQTKILNFSMLQLGSSSKWPLVTPGVQTQVIHSSLPSSSVCGSIWDEVLNMNAGILKKITLRYTNLPKDKTINDNEWRGNDKNHDERGKTVKKTKKLEWQTEKVKRRDDGMMLKIKVESRGRHQREHSTSNTNTYTLQKNTQPSFKHRTGSMCKCVSAQSTWWPS